MAAFVGTAMEWYDYYLFGTAASLVFSRTYFSTLEPLSATMAAMSTFGVGFVARPFGAMLFGWLGDRVGRKPALLASVLVIGIATGLIGLLPDFGSIGIAAPGLLVLLRLLQGIAVGGEWSGAVTLAVEHAPAQARGLYASLPQLGSPVASLMSSGAFALALLLPADDFDRWGWRVPFLAAFPLLFVALYIRKDVDESPAFLTLSGKHVQARPLPAIEVFRHALVPFLIAVASALVGVGGYHLLTTFAISYGTGVLGLPRDLMVHAALVAAIAEFAVIFVVGRLSDSVGADRITRWGSLLCAAIAFPVFLLLEQRESHLVVFAIVLGIVAVASVYAVSGLLLAQLFPVHLRCTGVALAYNSAGALAGFLPFLASATVASGRASAWGPAMLFVVISLISALGGALSSRFRSLDTEC